MAALKKFVQDRIADIKFTRSGPGHSLTESSRSQPQSTRPVIAEPRRPPSESAAAAGQAAVARLEQQNPSSASGSRKLAVSTSSASSSSTAIDPQRIKQEVLEETKLSSPQTIQDPPVQDWPQPQVKDTALNGVHVHLICPLCQHPIPHLGIREHMASCMMESYSQDPVHTSAKMIHTLCLDQEKKKTCLDALCRYMDNVVSHPDEEKYRKVRASNKAFQEKVCAVTGSVLFLEAVGFEQRNLSQDGAEEVFYVLSDEKAKNVQFLQECKQALMSTEPLNPKLDRNIQVFQGSSRMNQFNLTEDFYNLTVEEVKKEQKLRAEAAEREGVLRTKAMREKEEMRTALRHYRFVLLRVRLPDGVILQGVFRPFEKLADVRMFVADALVNPHSIFSLASVGKVLEDDSANLIQLDMVPTAVLNLTFDTTLMNVQPPFLKEELIARLQSLPA